MARIVKAKSAPDGELRVSIGTTTFSLDDDGSYDTNDRAVIDNAAAHPLLAVEYDSEDSPRAHARAEHRKIEREKRERAKAEVKRAEKEPHEPAPTVEVDVPGPAGTEKGEEVPVSDSQGGK